MGDEICCPLARESCVPRDRFTPTHLYPVTPGAAGLPDLLVSFGTQPCTNILLWWKEKGTEDRK